MSGPGWTYRVDCSIVVPRFMEITIVNGNGSGCRELALPSWCLVSSEAMRYSIEKVGEVVVARLNGDLWGKSEDLTLKDEIQAHAERGTTRFVIDFQRASALNSTGIGIVVSALTAIQASGGRLRLTGMNARIKATFEITGISRMLSIYDTVEAAAETPWPK